jgi:hypothetical protein
VTAWIIGLRYTEDELKSPSATCKRQLEQTGLTPEQCEITEDAIRVIRDYARGRACAI